MSNCCKENKDKCCGISKVVIPAALGDENGEYGPQNGAYSNTLVEYQASGVSYLYSNDGIPTRMGDGIVATIEVGETTTLQPGESATVENTGDKYHAVLNFGIPEGQKGDTGDAATVEVGATTTSAPGSDASVTNSGDEHNAVLDFVIPRGSQGPQGVPGQAATIQVGTVTTLDPDQDATVVNSGTTSAAVFDFGIPKGDKGDTGSVSSEVVTELPVPGDDSKLYLMEKNPTIETADGAVFTIQNAATDGEMRLVELKGNATQNGTPTPDAPVAVQTVSGEQVVKITNGTDTQSHTIDLGSIELAKIGAYQDRIYKQDGKWYLEKQIKKMIYTGASSETWNTGQYGTNSYHTTALDRKIPSVSGGNPNYTMSNLFKGVSFDDRATGGNNIIYTDISTNLYIRNTNFASLTDLRTLLSTNNLVVYYVRATPTTTEITNQTLIDQLEAVAELYGGTNNIMLVGTGAQGEIGVEYQTWDKYNRYDVYIWNDEINDYQILNS